MKTNNVCCRIYKEQLNLINQLPKKERAIVLLDVINHAFNQFEIQNANQIDNQIENQNDSQIDNQNEKKKSNQIENQFDNAYISVSVSVSDSVYNSVSSISKAVIEILRKSIVCKGFSSNYGGNRSGAGKKKAEEKPKETPKAAPKPRFVKPTLQEISTYCQENNHVIDTKNFYDFYESKGWKIGNSPMKDWQAAVRNWARRDKTGGKNAEGTDYNRTPELGKYAGFGRKIQSEL